MDKLLEIKDLYVTYRAGGQIVEAVNGINLTIEKGETLGLVGETGAGKTTTAYSIMQLLPKRTGKIKNGSIKFDGATLTDLDDKQMAELRGDKISMIFQDPMTSLNPVIPVGRQIAEALEFHQGVKKEEIDDRVDGILEFVGISPTRKREFPHQFSGGMKQRVVIAMALIGNPELLIADEPTTALDVTIQAQVLDIMDELKHKSNMSMLMITHDLGVVAGTCDKVAIMYAGEIIESGTVEDIFEGKNHHPYTVGLFGSIPNLEDDDTKRLSPIDGLMPDPTNLPKGCRFSTRCKQCMEVCKNEHPKDVVSGTQTIKCHLFSEE